MAAVANGDRGRRSGRQRGSGGGGAAGGQQLNSGGSGYTSTPAGAVAAPYIAAATPAPVIPAVPGGGEEDLDENGRPNDNAVTQRLMKTKMCYFFERGKCASQSCRYAHSATELRVQPNLQKTKLCKVWAQEGMCLDGENCVFAHGEAELRVTEGIYKTQMCHFFERGRCLKGDRCNHAHGLEDLRMPPPSKGKGGRGSAGSGGGHQGQGQGSNMVIGGGHASAGGMSQAPGGLMPIGRDGFGMGAPGAPNRSPLSPLPLAELLADMGNVHGASAHFAGHGPPGGHGFQPPAMGFLPGGSFFDTPEPHHSHSEAVAAAAAAASAAANAAMGGLHSQHPASSQPPSLQLGPPPTAPWNMPWTPGPATWSNAAPIQSSGAGCMASPGSPQPYQVLSPGASPAPPMVMHSPTPSPMPIQRSHFAPHHDPVHHLPPPEAGHHGGHGDPSAAVCDLDQRLRNLDVVCRDLAAEARGFTAVANVGVPGQQPPVGPGVVGGPCGVNAGGCGGDAQNPAEPRVLHRI